MGYLLLHSAFGPSSVQLREKTAREGKGRETQNMVKIGPAQGHQDGPR